MKMRKFVYTFGFYDLDGELVQIKIISTTLEKAKVKVRNILNGSYQIDEGIWLNNEEEY